MDQLPVGVVLEDKKVVYVPVPKAGCTSMLWTLAIAQKESFDGMDVSLAPETSRTMLVHDSSLWRRTLALEAIDAHRWRAIREDDGWLWFTMTRHPVRRLWAAWQSKLLSREPSFVRRFSGASWFPGTVESMADIRKAFVRFVAALADDAALLHADRHWQPQVEVLQMNQLNFNYVGRTENYAETLAVLRKHMVETGWHGKLAERHDNPTIMDFNTSGIASETLSLVEDIYSVDMETLGYRAIGAPTPVGTSLAASCEHLLITAVREIAARNDRIGDLLQLAATGVTNESRE